MIQGPGAVSPGGRASTPPQPVEVQVQYTMPELLALRSRELGRTGSAKVIFIAISIVLRVGLIGAGAVLVALMDKPMVITLGVWESNQPGGSGGNWVMAVAPKNKTLKIGDKAPAKKSGGNPLDFNRRGPEVDDEIPF